MKYNYLKLAVLISLMTVVNTLSFSQEDKNEKKIIYTTLDVKQNYEIISIIAAPEDIRTTSGFKLGPVEKAYNSAWEKFILAAKNLEADAVVGVRIEIENMNGNIVGRLLIYGTAVKFVEKNEEVEEAETD